MRRPHRHFLVVLSLLLCAAAVVLWVRHDRRTPPAPASQQARVADTGPGFSTARAAALAWLDACSQGDADAAHAVLVDDPAQRAFVAPALRFSAALRGLEAAAEERFGGASRRVTEYSGGSAKALEKGLTVDEDGDVATAKMKQAKLPLELRRVDGQWRVDLSAAMRDPAASRTDRAYLAVAAIAEELTKEVEAGAFESANEVRKEFLERRRAAAPK